MLIQQLILCNFQCWRDLTISLDPVTVLVGTSDAGKSAVIRALRWLGLNQPRGLDYTTFGQKLCEVTATTSNGTVTRSRSSSFNGYRIEYPNGEKLEYNRIGVNVPQEVTDLLGLAPLNMQLQLDPLFLITENAGTVGRMLNGFVDLSGIDVAVKKGSAMVRRAESEKGVLELSLSEKTGALETLAFDPGMLPRFGYIEGLQLLRTGAEHGKAKLEARTLAVRGAVQAQKALPHIAGADKVLAAVARLVVQRKTIDHTYRRLTRLAGEHRAALQSGPNIEGGDIVLLRLETLYQNRKERRDKQTTLSHYLESITTDKALMAWLTKETKRCQDELGQICPTCGLPVVR